jgi:hypothetical protein
MYYRATVHASTGMTPALLMLGRQMNLPLDVVFPPPKCENATPAEYADSVESRLRIASELARIHLLSSWEKMGKHSPVSRNVPSLDLTQPVLVFNPAVKKGYTPKLASFWKGPFKVADKVSNHLYRVDLGGRNGIKVVHRSNLFQPRTIQ